jgi:hypothetical protein
VVFPPVAKAVARYTLNSDTLLLDASLSSDPQHAPLTYQWTLVSGAPGTVIQSPSAIQTRVTVPEVGTYLFELTVNSPSGAATDRVSIQRVY